MLLTYFYLPIFTVPVQDIPIDPCNPSPCGGNAVCKERNGVGSCSCLSEYFGDPYTGCRPECVQNSECDRSRACINNKCKDPCPGVCGINAECIVQNHSPSCNCRTGYTGNPADVCRIIEIGKYGISSVFFCTLYMIPKDSFRIRFVYTYFHSFV